MLTPPPPNNFTGDDPSAAMKFSAVAPAAAVVALAAAARRVDAVRAFPKFMQERFGFVVIELVNSGLFLYPIPMHVASPQPRER